MTTKPLPPMPSTTLEHLHPDQICDEPPALFSLGNVVATPAALTLIEEYGASVPRLLNLHQTGMGWSELCDQDRSANWQAAFGGERVLSAFNIGSPDKPAKIWIITEWDRSYTTVLTPACY